jgi:hypothetical protein
MAVTQASITPDRIGTRHFIWWCWHGGGLVVAWWWVGGGMVVAWWWYGGGMVVAWFGVGSVLVLMLVFIWA